MIRITLPLAFLVFAGAAQAQPMEDVLLNTASTILCLSEDAGIEERLGTCTIALYHTQVNEERKPLLLARATAALASGNVETAEVDVQSALQHAPTDPAVWVAMGKVADAKQDPHASLSAYSTALSYDPRNVDAILGRAVTLHLLEDPGYCIADIEQVLARLQDQDLKRSVAAIRGLCRLDAGDFVGAIADLENSISDATDARTLISLSAAYLGNGQVDEAYASAEKAVELLKDSALAHDALYQAMEADDRVEEALDVLDMAAKKAPENVGLANLAAWHAYVTGDIDRAVTHLPSLVDSDVPEFQDTVGHVAMASGEPELAMLAFTKAVELGGVRMAEYYRERLSAQGIATVDALPVTVLPAIEQCIDKGENQCRLYEPVLVIDADVPLLKGTDPWSIK